MTEQEAQIVLVRDVSNRRVHKRFTEPGSHVLASYEGCNADSAGAYEVITPLELSEVDADDLCRRCFGTED